MPVVSPNLHIRIHAIITCATVYQHPPSSFAPDDILDLIQGVNHIFAPAGLCFQCDKAVDIETEADPWFNQPSSKPAWQYRAAQQPGKLVIYFTDGDAGPPPALRNYAYTQQQVGAASVRQLAHELGHYFHLSHTFVDGLHLYGPGGITEHIQHWVSSQPEAQDALQNQRPIPQALIEQGSIFLTDLLDGDRFSVDDTPPSLHYLPESFTPENPTGIVGGSGNSDSSGSNSGDSELALPIKVRFPANQSHIYYFSPDLSNIMSYGATATQFSPGQIRRIHQALRDDRQHLAA